MNTYTQTVCVCASQVCAGEKPLDLVVSAQRPVCVGSKHGGIMGDEVKSRGQEHNTVCIVYEYLVCVGGVMKRSRQGGSSAWIIRHVMEGVHKEFRLALRENK